MTNDKQDDLLCLPTKLGNSLGGLGPLVLVTRVSALLTLTDPSTLREAHLNADQYWRGATPLRALMGSRQLVEYVVLDSQGRYGAQRARALQKLRADPAYELIFSRDGVLVFKRVGGASARTSGG